jgi:hypothetical protein
MDPTPSSGVFALPPTAMRSGNAAVVRFAPTPTTTDTKDLFFRAALD